MKAMWAQHLSANPGMKAIWAQHLSANPGMKAIWAQHLLAESWHENFVVKCPHRIWSQKLVVKFRMKILW